MNRGRRRQHEDGDYGGGGGGGGGRYYKKRRTYSDNESREDDPIKGIIYDIGDRSKGSVEGSIEDGSKILEADLSSQKGKILETLIEVVTKFPEKCTIYSTLVGLLNAKNYNFGGEFIECIVKDFKDHVKKGDWISGEYCLRFISDLVNSHVISATSLLQLYDAYMEAAFDTSTPQGRRDWIVYAILNCLPWVGRELYDKKEQTMERLMITIDNYMKKRNIKHHALLRVWSNDEPHPQEEYLECLWAQIEKLKMDGWNEKHILRPYLVFDNILCEALQHNLPSIHLPQHQATITYPIPSVVFRLFDYTDCPEGPILPGAHSIERYLIEQELKAIIRKNHEERRECVAFLMDYPNNQRVPLEYMIVEVIFGELFRLPVPEYLEICYGALLLELCRRPGSLIPQALAQTTELLFLRLDSMNVSCIDRFVTWFAYHLSNNQFRWSWEDWAFVTTMDPEHPKPKFISEVIQKCIRLSYFERIVELVPKSLESLLPLPAEPLYKFDAQTNGQVVGMSQATQLQAAFREKVAFSQILDILKRVPNPSDDMEIDEDNWAHNPLAIQVFAQTLFMLGSKTLAHARAAILKYQNIFEVILKESNEEGQLQVLKCAFDVWKQDTQMLTVVVDLLLKYKIVNYGSVANWIFTKEMQAEFIKIYLWDILHMTIKKMNKNVLRLTRELSDAKEKQRLADESSSDSENESKNNTKKKSEMEVPSEDQIVFLEETLESQQADQKNLFLIVFQRFIMILSEHIANCDTNCKPFNTQWYQWTLGRLQEIFLMHIDQVYQYSSTLETLLFTPDLDKNILEIFEQFKGIKA